MEHQPTEQTFEYEKSPLKEAYELLQAKTPLELSHLYSEADQELFKSRGWDYENPELIINEVKEILEKADTSRLTDEEREWSQEIVWFWYHHAISCAMWKGDKQKTIEFATKALGIQPEDHPNKITKLLFFLVNDKLLEGEAWAKGINEEPEKDTAAYLIEAYKKGELFRPESD